MAPRGATTAATTASCSACRRPTCGCCSPADACREPTRRHSQGGGPIGRRQPAAIQAPVPTHPLRPYYAGSETSNRRMPCPVWWAARGEDRRSSSPRCAATRRIADRVPSGTGRSRSIVNMRAPHTKPHQGGYAHSTWMREPAPHGSPPRAVAWWSRIVLASVVRLVCPPTTPCGGSRRIGCGAACRALQVQLANNQKPTARWSSCVWHTRRGLSQQGARVGAADRPIGGAGGGV